MKQVRWIFLALCILQPLPSPAQSSASARELARRGAYLMSRNKVDEAIEFYNRAIKLSPDYADAYVRRGLAKRAKGDLTGSIADYEKATSIDPKSVLGNRFVAESYSNRGHIKLNSLNIDGAIEDFTRAIHIFPNEDHYYKRGHARLIKEELDEALMDLDKALSLAPPSTPSRVLVYADRGMIKLLQGKRLDAKIDFDECVRLNKSNNFDLDGYLQSLELQIILMRQHRAQQRKAIAIAGTFRSNLPEVLSTKWMSRPIEDEK